LKQLLLPFIILLHLSCFNAQNNSPNKAIEHTKIKEDLNHIISGLSQDYIYLQEKYVDLNCIQNYYEKQIPKIKTEEETVLLFEYLLDEFYDSHLILNTNRSSSFRLYSPIYATIENGKTIISNVWQTQIATPDDNILGAELLQINGVRIDEVIEQFPTHCNNKDSLAVREWIVNKCLAGRYNEPRILTIRLTDNRQIEFDLDELAIKQSSTLLTTSTNNDIGVIRINNSLGNNNLITHFDEAIDNLMDTKGLIIDLRNTVDGGNTYVARGIMGRFITEAKPYQIHWKTEQFDGTTTLERSWAEYVGPRINTYSKPVVILVGRWTGSMGEGIAIGFEGMGRAQIVGTKMERLAGEMTGFAFKNQTYGYRLSTAKLFHINGTAREKYVPPFEVVQSTLEKDEIMEKGIEIINRSIE